MTLKSSSHLENKYFWKKCTYCWDEDLRLGLTWQYGTVETDSSISSDKLWTNILFSPIAQILEAHWAAPFKHRRRLQFEPAQPSHRSTAKPYLKVVFSSYFLPRLRFFLQWCSCMRAVIRQRLVSEAQPTASRPGIATTWSHGPTPATIRWKICASSLQSLLQNRIE